MRALHKLSTTLKKRRQNVDKGHLFNLIDALNPCIYVISHLNTP